MTIWLRNEALVYLSPPGAGAQVLPQDRIHRAADNLQRAGQQRHGAFSGCSWQQDGQRNLRPFGALIWEP
jgi:hypothetical protein